MATKAIQTRPTPILDRTKDWAEAVVSGEIVAGPHVRNACRRHLDDLERGHERGLWFDLDGVERVFGFFENVLFLSEGQFEGTPFRLHPSQAFIIGSIFGWKRADGTRRFRRAYIEQGKGNGKALALDTPIPTPAGWTTMGDLRAGDWVYGDDGRPCRVLQAHPISHDRECYEVEFDDGEVIVASAEHLWATEMRCASAVGEPRATKGVAKKDWGAWRNAVRTTAEIAQTLRYANGRYRSANHSVALSAPLAGAHADLPIEPYGLGVWLGDGDSDCARITIGVKDSAETIEALNCAGWVVNKTAHPTRYRVAELQSRLRCAGLLGNKHIPAQYMRASIEQRWALLQGLMDTDGTVSSAGQCEFTQVKAHLAQQVLELALSLGLKATLNEGVAKLNGRTIGPKYRVTFHARADQPCFRLPRKLARLEQRHSRRRLSADRKIVDCRKVASVPVRCITVDSPNSMFLCGRSMIPTHNSPLAGGIGLFGLTADDEAGAQIYAAASRKDQADILFRDAVKMRDKSPALVKRLRPSGGPGREYNLAYLEKGSFFRPISREAGKTGSGPRPHFALCDEVHEHPDRSIMEMLERGFKFRRQPLLFMITNSGSDRNSVCWEEHEHAVKCAAGNPEAKDDDPAYLGEVIDDSTFAFVCSLDPGDDPLNDPSCWAKANPLLGVTVTEEYLAGVVAQAKAMPGKLNGILRLHFCVWTDAETAWMTRASLEPCLSDFDPAEHHGETITAGVDLSGTQDLTVIAYAARTGEVDIEVRDTKTGKVSLVAKPTFDVWIEAWTPEDTLAARAMRDKADYPRWVDEGHLLTTPGRLVDFRHVAMRLADAATAFDISTVAYDRYAYGRFESECQELGLTLAHVEHPQGGKKRGKPIVEGAEGLWMPGSVKIVEEAILQGRVRFRRNPILIMAFMSAVTETDPWGNYWLAKRKSVNRIDAAVSVCMAMGAAMAMQAPTYASPWDDPNFSLMGAS